MRVRPMLLRRPSFLFDCFVKIWEKGQKFFGQMVYRPPLAKNSPYAYAYGKEGK